MTEFVSPKSSRKLSITDRNTEVPFFPSRSWSLTAADLALGSANTFNETFSWIQAFFNASDLSSMPTLLIWDAEFVPGTSTPVINPIFFAYSGERINIKGCAIVSTGQDTRGVTWESTPIGSDPDTDLLLVSAYGGAY